MSESDKEEKDGLRSNVEDPDYIAIDTSMGTKRIILLFKELSLTKEKVNLREIINYFDALELREKHYYLFGEMESIKKMTTRLSNLGVDMSEIRVSYLMKARIFLINLSLTSFIYDCNVPGMGPDWLFTLLPTFIMDLYELESSPEYCASLDKIKISLNREMLSLHNATQITSVDWLLEWKDRILRISPRLTADVKSICSQIRSNEEAEKRKLMEENQANRIMLIEQSSRIRELENIAKIRDRIQNNYHSSLGTPAAWALRANYDVIHTNSVANNSVVPY